MDNKDLKTKWNRLASVYDFIVSTELNAYTEIKRKIIERINFEDRILELGSGSGQIALDLCLHCSYIEAGDISDEMVARANALKVESKYQNVEFRVRDVYNIDAEDHTYDVVILSNTLHILHKPDQALNEIKRVLKPGGKLIAPTYLHNQNTGAQILSRLITSIGFPTQTRYDEDSYLAFLRGHSFKIRHATIIPARIPVSYVEAILDDEPEHRAKITIK
jgi:ubiquinone/menaquinone biosynthesis C-methylase UbiE